MSQQKTENQDQEIIPTFITSVDDMHPLNCEYKDCIHCNRIESENHNPKICQLCDY